MKWIIPALAAAALAIFSLSIPSPVFTTEAHADRMNGRGNCSGGVCTGGGTAWSSGANRLPKTAKTTKTKK
jgi:hypothetical protein